MSKITGCRFYISIMADNYVEILLNAIQKVNTKNVWSNTDKISTVYRGEAAQVVDCVKACFLYAYDKDVHMNLEATFSKGCPSDGDEGLNLSNDIALLNGVIHKFNVTSKVSFYPLGVADYMKHIENVVNMAIDKNIYVTSKHYVSILEGDVNSIFTYIQDVINYAEQNIDHYVFEVTLSVNSPSKSSF